jgi:hypothetical protein
MDRQPPVEYAALGMRTEIRGQVNAVQRQRIAFLMQLEASRNGLLDKADKDELTKLQKAAGIAPDAPISLVNKWAAGLLGATIPNSLQRSMTPRQRQVEILAMRWPRQPLTGRQAALELRRQSMMPGLSPRQRELWAMREGWTS